jgi:DNA-binding MarR family transcriptional regulator
VLAGLLADFELNDTQLLLLWACRDAGSDGIAQKRLAALAGLSTAQVSGLVERMNHRGLIAECANSGDRRRRLWSVTAAGRDRLDQILKRLTPLADQTEARLDGAESPHLVGLLDLAGQAAAEWSRDARTTANLRVFPAQPTPSDAGESRGQEGA